MINQEFIALKKEIYESLLDYIEGELDDCENACKSFIDKIEQQQIQNDRDELYELLELISKISKNHHRCPKFIEKIKDILLHISDQMKQNFTNAEIFNLFKNNKLILYFLFSTKILAADDYIFNFLTKKTVENSKEPFKNHCNFDLYFYPEFKEYFPEKQQQTIEEELFQNDDRQTFDQKREKGENDSYLCEIIRNDSIVSFVSYVNRTNYQLNGKIQSSIFETNSFLIGKEPTLIEYAAFFGSIQIIQYLKLNDVELNSSLWLYAIHSQCAELINYLEENKIKPPDSSYENILKECIKCHHNDIANYIASNFFPIDDIAIINNQVLSYILQYHNYYFFSDNVLNDEFSFLYLCKFNYVKLVKIFLKYKKIEINKKYISNIFLNEIVKILLSEEGVKIDENCFAGCTKLTHIFIPSTITYIGTFAFINCTSLSQVILPLSLTEIKEYAFHNCTSLRQIEIPSSIITIGDAAFDKCASLTEILIPSSVKSLGNFAFIDCSSLKKVIFEAPSSLTEIKEKTFQNCKSLTEIKIPPSIKIIDIMAFCNCESLKEITIPSSVTGMYWHSFSFCISLTNVIFESPSSLTSIGSCSFHNCSSLKKISIPSSVTLINNEAFSQCSLLSEVSIPNSVTTIGQNAFNGCDLLKRVSLPKSVTSIGDNAFNYNTKVTKI